MSDNNDSKCKIEASLGPLSLNVEGNDMEKVQEVFDEQWSERMLESRELIHSQNSNLGWGYE